MFEFVRDHGLVIGGTIAAMSMTIAFGLGWALALFAWLNPVMMAKLRYTIIGK